jgi:Zn-dependent protease with chaperone function
MTNPPDRVRTAAGYEVSKPSHFRLALLALGVFVAFNASAVQVSRAGIFWPRNTLLLGYPLLAMLSPKQTRAVIAHELGHMTHAHGRISSWVHRTRLSWVRLMKNLDERGATPAHAHLLFRWYVPRLHAMSAAVSRQQELVADHLAASVTSPETTAQALVATRLEATLWTGHSGLIYSTGSGTIRPPRVHSG